MSRSELRRAERYAVQLAIHYRQDDLLWRQGRTENVSTSGVLFDPDPTGGPIDPGASLEMRLIMPPEVVGPVAARVVCAGSVVRTVPRTAQAQSAMAATIVSYRFAQGDDDVW